MATPHGIKLAVHLISTHFGDIVSKVCECLLRQGTISLPQVIRFTEFTKQNVTNALLVLIQHNCVQAFTIQQPGGFGEPPKIVTQYMALFDNIIHRMRFPKFLDQVSKDFGKECKEKELLEGLLQHGRLSFNQIMDRHKDKHDTGESNPAANVLLHENFNKLAQARYIERCPAHEPFLEPSEEGAKKRTAKSKMSNAPLTLEARALSAAAPMDSIRFLVEVDTWNNDALDDDSKNNPNTQIVGEKRKQDCLEDEADVWATNKKKEILWRVNFEEFVRRLRHKCCENHVTTRLDSIAGSVLKAIFDASRREETKVKMESTVPLPMGTIFEEVMKNEEGQALDLVRVRASLVQLGCELPTIGIDEYSVDLNNIINQAQSQEVESIVFKKYGPKAYRIFRLLSANERLFETEKISMGTFVEKKDALKILFQLWKDNFLQLERLGNEAQKSDIMLWKLNKRSLWEQVVDDMYHAALNLKLRLVYELEQANEILRVHKGKELANKQKRVRETWEVLESSLMILDDAIMLFHDF